jgi:hypothetical protein
MALNPRIRQSSARARAFSGIHPKAVLSAFVLACHPAADPAPEPSSCGPSVPPTAQHPLALPPGDLAGDYQLIQVHTQPKAGVRASGLLHLAPLDSATKAAAVGGPIPDLTGWLEPGSGQERDQVALAGEHVRLGGAGEPGVQHLTITAVAPDGFWGWWRARNDLEMAVEPDARGVAPEPAGYFCALRRGSTR